jgi:hypothetical protein
MERNNTRWEVCSEGAAVTEATRLMTCRRAAEVIARSMAERLGCAVLVRHNIGLPTLDARIKAQRVVRRYRATQPEFCL